MPDIALVIGIDGYGPEEWRLGGAVRDALEMSRWLTTAGGVLPANLWLLLSPPAGAAPVELPEGVVLRGAATSPEIAGAIADLQNLQDGGGRLWVYYAGHGASVRWFPEPVLIPADVTDLQRQGQSLLGLSYISRSLVEARFAEQIFLIDACRDFALQSYRPPAILPAVGPYSPNGDPDAEIAGERPLQYMLYSVAPGKRAAEAGYGIWTKTFLEGLDPRKLSYQVSERGQKPGGGLRWEIRLAAMAEWLRKRVAQRIARLPGSAQSVQKPEYEPDPRGGDPLLLAFDPAEAPRAQVEVFVDPEIAHRTCEIAILEYDGAGRERVTEASGPPVVPPVSFSLFPSFYSIRARAERYILASKPWSVHDEPAVELTLEEAPPADVPRAPEPTRGLGEELDWSRGFGVGDPVRSPGPGSRPRSLDVSNSSGRGRLSISSPDRYAVIEVLDERKRVERTGVGRLEDLLLDPGIYRVRLRLPGSPPVERTVEVRAGSEQEVELELPPARLEPDQADLLRTALGPVGNARLASLLAFAAYAAQQPEGDAGLRRLGVHPLQLSRGFPSGLLALVGSTAAEGTDLRLFLRESFLRLRDAEGLEVSEGFFVPLDGLPSAVQHQMALTEPGSLQAELHLPGFAPTCYSVAVLPARITVLIAVVETDGSVEVQQYLFPAPGRPVAAAEYVGGIEDLRRLELAQSFYAAGERDVALAPLGEGNLEELLNGEWLDPLLGCLAGYILVRRGDREDFAGAVRPGAHDVLEDPEGPAAAAAREQGPIASALRNLVAFFPELPDVHILAGLADPVEERRSSHFERAFRRGLPVFAEGARALAAWARRQGIDLPAPLAEPLARLLSGSPWAAWEAAEDEE